MRSRTVIHAGLATGSGFVPIEQATESSTYVLNARFEAGGQVLEWRSVNLGGEDGPIGVLQEACRLR